MTHFKRSISLLSVLALTVSLLPTVTAQTVPPTVQILDNASTSGFTKTGNWYTVNDSASYAGKYMYALAGASTTKAVWTFTNLTPGQYKVSVTYRPKSYFSKSAQFRVFDGGVTGKELGMTTVNQSVRASSGDDVNGTPWQTLGTAGSHYAVLMNSLSVTLTANATAQVQADAVRIERVGDLTGEEMLRDFSNASTVSGTTGGEGEPPVVSEIDVLVLYTADTPASIGKTKAELETMIRRAFDCTKATDPTCPEYAGIPVSVNGIMNNSAVPAHFRISDIYQTSESTLPSLPAMLTSLQASDSLEALRTALHADIVVLFVADSATDDVKGLTTIPSYAGGSFIDQVFGSSNRNQYMNYRRNAHFSAHSVIRVINDAVSLPILATHEIGHIFGTGHEPESIDPTPTGIEVWSHARTVDGGIKTIDSAILRGKTFGCPVLGCTTIPLFSNPNLTATVNGITYALGVAGVSDNVRTMTKMAPMVAGYSERPSIGFQNPLNCLDTNGDDFVSPIDSLRVINYLNAESTLEISKIPEPRRMMNYYGFVNVTGDGFISPIDSLWIINYLNDPTNPAFAPATVCPH